MPGLITCSVLLALPRLLWPFCPPQYGRHCLQQALLADSRDSVLLPAILLLCNGQNGHDLALLAMN
jgi:hypothetical protein